MLSYPKILYTQHLCWQILFHHSLVHLVFVGLLVRVEALHLALLLEALHLALLVRPLLNLSQFQIRINLLVVFFLSS